MSKPRKCPKSWYWAILLMQCHPGYTRVCVMIEFSYKRGPKKVLHILPPNIWILKTTCYLFWGIWMCVFLGFKKIQKDINNIILNSILKKIGLFQIISLSDKRFFLVPFVYILFPCLGAILISQNNLKCWRQYMQNFLRTPLIREFYRNADSRWCL